MKILGISSFCKNSTVSLIIDYEIIGVAKENWFTESDRVDKYPLSATNYLLNRQNIKIYDLDYISYNGNPAHNFDKDIAAYIYKSKNKYNNFKEEIKNWFYKAKCKLLW